MYIGAVPHPPSHSPSSHKQMDQDKRFMLTKILTSLLQLTFLIHKNRLRFTSIELFDRQTIVREKFKTLLKLFMMGGKLLTYKCTVILNMKTGSERLKCAESKLEVCQAQLPTAPAVFNCQSHTGSVLLHVKPFWKWIEFLNAS